MLPEYKLKALARLKRASGQINGIIKMIEEDKYCADILQQMLALQGSVKGVIPLILESHLNTCGETKLSSKNKEQKDKFIKEIVKICELSSR